MVQPHGTTDNPLKRYCALSIQIESLANTGLCLQGQNTQGITDTTLWAGRKCMRGFKNTSSGHSDMIPWSFFSSGLPWCYNFTVPEWCFFPKSLSESVLLNIKRRTALAQNCHFVRLQRSHMLFHSYRQLLYIVPFFWQLLQAKFKWW